MLEADRPGDYSGSPSGPAGTAAADSAHGGRSLEATEKRDAVWRHDMAAKRDASE